MLVPRSAGSLIAPRSRPVSSLHVPGNAEKRRPRNRLLACADHPGRLLARYVDGSLAAPPAFTAAAAAAAAAATFRGGKSER